MTLQQIIDNVDRSDTNYNEAYTENLFTEFDMEYRWFDYNKEMPLKSYWFEKWYCTDTWVGKKVFFLDDIPVAVSFQDGRKCDENFLWMNAELKDKVYQHLMSLPSMPEEDFTDYLDKESLDDEWGDGYTLEFSSQFLVKKAVYIPAAEPIDIIKTLWGYKTITWQKVEIKFPCGNTAVVECNMLLIPYNKGVQG